MTVAVMSNKEWVALTKAFDKPDWLADERFATPMARDRHVNERLEMTQEILKTKTTAEWLRDSRREGVPCAPALTRNEVADFPQVRASESLIEYEHHAGFRLRQTRPAARFAKTPSEVRRGAPMLGEHNLEILGELGLSGSEIQRLRTSGVIGEEHASAGGSVSERMRKWQREPERERPRN